MNFPLLRTRFVRQVGAMNLLAVLFLITVIMTVMGITLTMNASSILDSNQQASSVQAMLLAETGFERQGRRLSGGTLCGALAPDTVTHGNGTITLVSAATVLGQCQMRITGTVGAVSRTVDGWYAGGGGGIALDATNALVTSAASTNLPLTVGTGANRVLVIGLTSDKAGGTVTAITYTTTAPSSATPTLAVTAGSGGNPGADIYYLVNPPSGAGQVNITMSAAGPIILGAQVFTGVNQSAPIHATAATSNPAKVTTPTLSITTTVANTYLIDVLAVDKNVTTRTPTNLVPGATQTLIWRLGDSVTSKITGAASRRGPQAAGTSSMAWSYSGIAEKWNSAIVALNPAGVPQLVRWSEVIQ